MNRHALQRGASALGLSLAVAMFAFAPAYAQPQQLPGPQYQAPQYQAPQYQYAPPAQPQYGPPQDQSRYGGQYDRRRDQRYGENRIDRRLTVLHQRLGITPAQEAAWMNFAAQMRNAEMTAARAYPNRADQQGRPANVVQRLELRERMLQTRSAQLDGMVRALQPLYASFSDDQKRAADQLLFRREQGPGFAGGPGVRNARPGYGTRSPG